MSNNNFPDKIQNYINYIADPRARRSIKSLFGMILSDADPSGRMISFTKNSYVTSGTRRAGLVTWNQKIASLANIEGFKSVISSEYKTGGWSNALVGSIDYGTTGYPNGMAAAICAEMIPMNGSLTRGALYALDCVFGCGASASWGSAGPVAFMHFENWGTATYFSANAFLFHLSGETAATGGMLSLGSYTLKIRIGTTTKYLLLSDTENVYAGPRLGSQLYHNLSDQSYTVLKIHNHDTTAEIGGLETKGELINTTGTVVGEQSSWSYEPTGLTGTPTGISASANVMALAPSHIITSGNLYALSGEAQIHGTLNGGTVNVAGVIGIISGAGATTLCLHMAGVQSAINVTNPTTGTLSHFLANTTGTGVIDHLICMQASQYITNFASFNSPASGKCIEVNTTTLTLTETSHHIRINVAGAAGYIPVFDASNWA